LELIDTFSLALLNMDIILFHYYERDMEVFFVSDGKFTVHCFRYCSEYLCLKRESSFVNDRNAAFQ
jgi:hypothetical protein